MTKRVSDFLDEYSCILDLEQCARPSKAMKLHYLTSHSEAAEQIGTFMSSEKASSVSDITLISSDGVHIPAIRALLVIRSSHFEKMLTNGFLESSSNVVKVPIPATPLRHVLKYVYCGDSPLLRNYHTHLKCDLVGEVIDLASAADYLYLDKLLDWCIETIRHSITLGCHLLCCLLEELTSKRSKWVDDSGLLEEVRSSMGADMIVNRNEDGCHDGCKLPHGVLHFSDVTIRMHYENVFQSPEEPAEYSSCLFQALLIWASNNTLPIISDVYNFDEDSCILVMVDKKRFLDERLETAKYLAGKFDLGKMTPAFLNEIVEESGLVEPNAINEAYKKLALRFEERECKALDDRDKLQSKVYKLEREKRRYELLSSCSAKAS